MKISSHAQEMNLQYYTEPERGGHKRPAMNFHEVAKCWKHDNSDKNFQDMSNIMYELFEVDKLWFRKIETTCLDLFGFKYMAILHKSKRTGTIVTLLNLALNMTRKQIKNLGENHHGRSLHLRDNEGIRGKTAKGKQYRRKKGTFDDYSLQINPITLVDQKSPPADLEITPPAAKESKRKSDDSQKRSSPRNHKVCVASKFHQICDHQILT